MAKNECGVDVPDNVSAKARQLGCIQGSKYVYPDGQYDNRRPVASIGCRRASRFRSDFIDYCKVELINGWVAFRSPSSIRRNPLPGISPPLFSRIGEITRTKKIDGSPLVYRVEDEEVFIAPSNEGKAFCLQKLRFDDGRGIENGHIEFRICYYMKIHKEHNQGKWGFGQFAPMMTEDELKLVVKRMKEKGWLE
ncbi:hypothetical protein JXQ70_16945 [bacterium]|nr:hypothetical protein [bacterium]